MRIVKVPELNIKVLPLAEKIPDVLIVKDEVGENVTLFKRETFPLLPTLIVPPVQVLNNKNWVFNEPGFGQSH